MNKKQISSIQEYCVTFIVTVIVIFSLCMCAELQLYFNIEKVILNKELALKNLSKFYNVDQLEKMHLNDPENHLIILNLAKAYEAIERYDIANELYKEAIIKSKNSEYSIYNYALFTAKRKWYGLAADLAEELYSKNKLIYKYKTEIYIELAKALDSDSQFEGAVKAYQLAYKYAKNAKNKSLLEQVRNEYSLEYTRLADYNISINKPDEAILNLKNSLSIKEQIIAKYKLALIYKDSDKICSEKYFSQTFRKSPYLVNPYIYHKLLEDLILEFKKEDNKYYVNYYQSKLNYLKDKIQEYYIYKGDLAFSNSHIVRFKKPFKKEQKFVLCFNLENNSKRDIKTLFIKAEMLYDGKTYTTSKQVINGTTPFSYLDKIDNVSIDMPSDFDFGDRSKKHTKSSVVLKYFVKKQNKAPWTLAKIEFLKF